MAATLNAVLLVLSASLLLPAGVFLIECLAALLPSGGRNCRRPSSDKHAVVLVPAHNEETIVAATIESLRPELAPGDRIVVIADNCTDTTAEVSRQAGADVIERHDTSKLGKIYALGHAVRSLASSSPDVIVVFDADCRTAPGAIRRLVDEVAACDSPVQAQYLLDAPPEAGSRGTVSALSFMVRNHVRARGLHRLGLPCMLSGCGMAFPWRAISTTPIENTNMAEDYQLSINLALRGHLPQYCEEARVTGFLPQRDETALRQRKRWEHGLIYTVLTQVPRLLFGAFRQRSAGLLGLCIDQCVPPLALLAMLILVVLVISLAAMLTGAGFLPFALATVSALSLLGGTLAGWWRFGRPSIPSKALFAIAFYIPWKIPLYLAFLFNRQRTWLRTDRETVAETKGDVAEPPMNRTR